MRANTGVTPSLGVLGRNTKKAPSSKVNKCKEICESEYNFKVNSVVVVEKQPKSGPAACSLLGMNEAALTDSNMCSGALLTHLTPLFSKSDLHEVSAESNRTLSSLKESQAAVSRRIVSGTSQRPKSLRDDWLEMGSHLITYFRFWSSFSTFLRRGSFYETHASRVFGICRLSFPFKSRTDSNEAARLMTINTKRKLTKLKLQVVSIEHTFMS